MTTPADPPPPGAVLWLEQALALDPGAACPPLAGVERADVCIVGGGFTGLWTALALTERDPTLRVVLLEAEICGAGASGRNGGWCFGWHEDLPTLIELAGAEQARWLVAESAATVERIGAFAAEHGIECGFRRAGAVLAATARAQLGAWRPALQACVASGFPEAMVERPADDLRRRTGCPLILGGVLVRDVATVHPGILVRGLRRVALERGVRIFEASAMRALGRGRPAVVHTLSGRVEADRVVLATGAWSAGVRELRRAFVPVASHIVATEAAPERIARLGWTGGEALCDARLLVHYAQVTRDGRIVFGRGGGALAVAGRLLPSHHRDVGAVRTVAADFRRFFPDLRDVRLTHAWGGPVDHSPWHLPFAGTLGEHGTIHFAAGFSGNGVGPTALFGRLLASLALDAGDTLATSALAFGPPAYLPPEPLRSVGGRLVRGAVARAEGAEEDGRTPRLPDRLLRRLAHATVPRVLEPRLRHARGRAAP